MEYIPQELTSQDWRHKIAWEVDELAKPKNGMAQFRTMITAWSSDQNQREREHDYWQGQRQRHFEEEVSTDPDLQKENRQPPYDGWVFESYDRAEHFGSKNRQHRIISYQGWAPAELTVASEPDYQLPLPLPARLLTLPEKYAILAAVHDYFCKGAEHIDPWHDAKDASELMAALAYTVLVSDGVEQIAQSDQGAFEVFLEDIRADIAAIPVESPRQLAAEPKSNPAADKSESDDPTINIFQKCGDFWTVRFNGETINVKHTKGMDYIAKLLASPKKPIAATGLINHKVDAQLLKEGKAHQTEYFRDENDPQECYGREKNETQPKNGDDQPFARADHEAIKAYREALTQLNAALDKAEANNDVGEIEKLRHDKQILIAQLKEDVCPNNSLRNFASDADHIRKAVANAINRVLENIKEHHNGLYRHLDNSINRGFQLMYAPEQEIKWKL